MKKEISKNSLANRRLFMKNMTVLADFSQPDALKKVILGDGFAAKALEPLKKDIVSVGNQALRLVSEGKMYSDMSFSLDFDSPHNLTATPMLVFAFSAYDGEQDSQYFEGLAENMYFVEKPDPLLVSKSYLTVRLYGCGDCCERTVQLTNYGFNRVYANFSGEKLLPGVEKAEFVYYIDEDVPAWQKICKLDTVFAGMSVDFTLQGSGMQQLFSVENGELVHEQGRLEYTFQKGSQLTFPDLSDAADTVCDVAAQIKNTVLMRLSADLDTLPIEIWFKTQEDNTFDNKKSKRFVLTDACREQTVYFDFSNHPLYTGRLTGLRLVVPDAQGTLIIRKIAFEQEKKTKESAGSFTACRAENDRIVFECAIEPGFIGEKLEIYEIYPHIIHENLSELECVCSAVAQPVTVLHTRLQKTGKKTTRLAAQFLGVLRAADGSYTTLKERTMISNWRELCGGNPYAFTLPALEVDVTKAAYGAAGDAFTDDTAAIQKAIDTVAQQGGGRVLVPGDDSIYGKRYIVTNLYLRSNVELFLAPNAVLWQADDISMYQELPRFGHNVSMTGINWPANHTSGNMPLLYAFREHHFRLTGGGTIRMCDTESASEDGHFEVIGDNVCIGCTDRMHVTPLGVVECDNYEISDISLIRSSAVHINMNHSKRAFIGNVTIDEAKCTGADGAWPTGSNDVKFTRIMMNTNDDGICLSSSYNDPRNMLWVYTHPGMDCGTHNIEISHSYLNCFTFTASAISFCTWGTDAPDLSLHEVSGIRIFDTSLEGRASIGGWTDNPYYGVTPFDASEKDDFSPVKDVDIHSCELRSPLSIEPLRITNCFNDIGIKSPSDFEYGSFSRRPAEQNPGWRLGLCNWSYDAPEAVGQMIFYGDTCAYLNPLRDQTCNLYQGLYLEAGEHRLCFRYKANGSFRAFVRDTDGCELAAKPFSGIPGSYCKGKPWHEEELVFTVKHPALYRIGVEGEYRTGITLYVTGFQME